MERVDQFAAALTAVRVPLFLARTTASGARRRLVLHTMDRAAAPLLRKQAEAAIRARGIGTDCKVVVHTAAALRRKRSLEAFNDTFGDGETVFDPTGAIGRAASIVKCAALLRRALGAPLQGVLLDANRRALFVILDERRFPAEPAAMLEGRLAAMATVASTVENWRSSDPRGFDIAVRIGFEPPVSVGLIPVDRRSEQAARPRGFLARLRKPGLARTFASLVGLGSATAALAGDLTGVGKAVPPVASESDPAVAAPNLGIVGTGGWLNGNGFNNQGWGAAGLKATTPLGERFGAQFDAAFGSDQYYGVGGHFFFRDSLGLIGLLGSYESMDGRHLSRVAAEGELYQGPLTWRGEVGAQAGNAHGAFGALDLTFYPTPNFALSLGGEFGSRSLARGSLEWQPAASGIPGLSLFADAEAGTHNYASVLGGIKYYFGTNGASLKERDRRYDPGFSLFNMDSLTVAGYSSPH
jgi:hypothetical protein